MEKPPAELFMIGLKKGMFDETFFNTGCNCFCFKKNESDKSSKLTGINPVLRTFFYSNYEFDKKRFAKIKKKNGGYIKTKKRKVELNSIQSLDNYEINIGKKTSGKVRGALVHEQFKLISDFNSFDAFFSVYNYLDNFTMMGIKWLQKKQLFPLKSELAISDLNLNIGTAVDMVASDSAKNLVIIEWKTGNPDTFKYYSGRMENEMKTHFNNSPYSQAILQLLMTYQILVKNYFLPIKKCYIVHISEEKIEEYSPTNEMLEFSNLLYGILKKHLDFSKKK